MATYFREHFMGILVAIINLFMVLTERDRYSFLSHLHVRNELESPVWTGFIAYLWINWL